MKSAPGADQAPAVFHPLASSQGLAQDTVLWLSALDPASPRGLGPEATRGAFPSHHPSTHLVFHGPRLVVTSRRHGGELEIRAGCDHLSLGECLGFLTALLARQSERPVNRIRPDSL